MLITDTPKSRSTSWIADSSPCARRLDDLHDFPDSGAGGDHIINDGHLALQRCPYQRAAFTMILGFLAIETVWQINIKTVSQGNRGRCGQRNSLVGGPEDRVDVLGSIVDQCLGIVASQPGQTAAGIEQPGIEEVGAGTP